ncbi:hypothetical protein [Microbispora sp. NBRC 16548]|uniref:hypothetical protein n=1 Tax=Microbispora sp. NBRC 16548 TaxID=3030994 RepID=UPI0024A5F56B|nr:hypothetical protein [Microbispora sp. NBRC 16548]GLX09272.1 hypothetical protein Misp03_61980 [Microbispora sp. NBRC 16548]
MLDDQFGDPVKVGDHPAQVALRGLGSTRPGALTACQFVSAGADLRVTIEKEGLDVYRCVIVLAQVENL